MPGLAVAVAESESNDTPATADPLTTGEATTGGLADGDDDDWFSFQAQRGQQILITSSRSSGLDGRHDINLYRERTGSSNPLFITSVGVSSGEDERFGITVEITGTYYVLVENDPGDYSFAVDLIDPTDTEPNEIAADAVPITSGQTVSANLGPGDDDWFSFEAERGQSITVTSMRSSQLGGRHDINLYRERTGSSNPLFITSVGVSSGETDDVGITVQLNATYYILVENDEGDYSFTMTLDDLGPNEPNEEASEAVAITPGQEVSGELTTGDEDWYSFEVTRGDQITVTSSRSSQLDGRHDINLYRERTGSSNPLFITAVGVSSGDTDEQVGDVAELNTTYYVLVENDLGPYSFTMTRQVVEDTEPNEVRTDATELFVNPRAVPFTRTLSVGDEDWYSVPAQAGENITVTASRPTGVDGGFNAYIYDGDSFQTSTFGSSTSTNSVVYEAPRSDTYFVRAFTSNPGEYELEVDVAGTKYGLPNDRFEPNEDIAGAVPLDLGVYSDLRIVDTDVDVFAVELEQGDTLSANVRFDDSSDDLSLSVRDAQGTTVAQSTAGSNIEELSFLVPSTGTYYLQVAGSGSGNTIYQLAARVPTQVTLAPVPQSVLLTPEDTTQVDVTIGGANNGVSNYEFTIAVGDTNVTTIETVEIVGTTGDVTIAPGGGSATVNVTSASLTTGATATLARVTLNSSDTEGSTALTLVASGVTDSTGFDYIAQTANGTVRVASGPGDVTGSGNPARDLDGNGLYEDVNGDGQQTFSDVIELAFILDNQDIAPFFDFDGSGDLAFSDVIELAFDL